MAEGLQEMRRNSSGAFSQNKESLAKSVNIQKDKSDGVSPLDFDENYLMFGGDKYIKVLSP